MLDVRPIAKVLMIALVVSPVAAQSIDLTGAPAAVIKESFSQIGGVRDLPGGFAIVTDQFDRKVLLADFAHGTVRQIGRQGEGPGEYRYPMKPFPGPGTSTLVLDASLARILVFSASGQVTSTLRKPENAQLGEVTELRGVDARGLLYFETNSFNPESGGFTDTVAIVRMDVRGGSAKAITRISSGGRVHITMASGPASLARSITPFPHIDTWVVLPEGRVAVIHPDPYRVDLVDSTGAHHAGTAVPYTPIPVSAKDRAAVHDSAAHVRSTASMKGGGGGASGAGFDFPDDAFPKVMPPYVAGSAHATLDGKLWVGRSHATADAAMTYDIFDGSGRRIGSARLRPHSTVVGFGAGSVYVARQDPDSDLIYLEKYAIR